MQGGKWQAESSFFEKKEAKKLCPLAPSLATTTRHPEPLRRIHAGPSAFPRSETNSPKEDRHKSKSFFASFFPKKEDASFLPLACLLFALLLSTTPALAVQPNERLPDPALEARAREISKGLRCLVCRNESIDESNADLARDLRLLVRERLTKGDSDAAVRDFVVARYGDYVLLNPPLKGDTLVLWFGPAAVLVATGIGVALFLRRRVRAIPAATPLTAEEQARLDRLLGPGA